jgi:SAM-dependent methyltransferase
MQTTPIYFTHGDLIAESGNMRIYDFNGLLHLEEGPGHTLWAIEDEIDEYKEQIGNYPRGDCLEIGLGLGIASRYILSCKGVNSLTTVEISEDTIIVQKQAHFIDDKRHMIVCMDGLSYINLIDNTYDFIFMDFYHFIDEEGLPEIEAYVKACKRILRDNGKIVGWFDIYTPEEFVKPFYKLFE